MTALRLGELCAGYGGLGMAVARVLDVEPVWFSEVDPAPSKILAHHWPHVPNLGDLTRLDWSAVEPVDVLSAGYPCQPFSHAGKRKGTKDERHLWPYIAAAVRVLRPRLVVLENVAGHLSLGFGDVLGDLAALGYDTRWGCVRASDVGAPHRRERVFIVAHPHGEGLEGRRQQPGQRPGERATRPGGVAPALSLMPTPKASDGPNGGPGMRNGRGVADALPGVVALLLPTPEASDGSGGRRSAEMGGNRPSGAKRAIAIATAVDHLLPTPTATDHKASGGGYNGQTNVTLTDATVRQSDRFGDYAPAIARWEPIIGRPAPDPTTPAPKGGRRLSPAFVEWMMGLPAGHVTDPAVGLIHRQQLKALGNGVVPQQAAYAIAALVGVESLGAA